MTTNPYSIIFDGKDNRWIARLHVKDGKETRYVQSGSFKSPEECYHNLGKELPINAEELRKKGHEFKK